MSVTESGFVASSRERESLASHHKSSTKVIGYPIPISVFTSHGWLPTRVVRPMQDPTTAMCCDMALDLSCHSRKVKHAIFRGELVVDGSSAL